MAPGTLFRRTAWLLLGGTSDWLCSRGLAGTMTAQGEVPPRQGFYRVTFGAGHRLGEVAWRLRP